ncbi:MAG: PAS domain S-box protein [Pleurocapsa minor GSE-CHR-MK-17-07R]|nr:PAS domain S-box protein [Pleurocapsa minor GSE-CHR-MK 17-07R]
MTSALESQLEQYRRIARHLPRGGIVIYDADLRLLVAEGRAFEALQLPRHILEGRTVHEAFSPSVLDELVQVMRAGLAGEPLVREITLNGKVGQLHTVPLAADVPGARLCMLVITDITELRSTVSRLEDTRRFLDHVAATVPDIVYVYDLAEARNVYVNREIASSLGYSPDEIRVMGSALLEKLMHPDDVAGVMAHHARLRTYPGDDILEHEYRMLASSGEWRWLNSRDRVFRRDAAGVSVQILGVASDVTERKREEARVIEQRAEIDRFFDISLDLWCIADTSGYFRRVNRAWELLLGYSMEELEGRQFLEFVHPDDIPATLAALASLEAQVPLTHFTNRYRARSGEYRTIEWRSQPYGKLLFASARDITQRKQMQDALLESELRYRSLINTTSEGIVLQNKDGSIQTCNAAAEQILGLTADQMAGRTSVDARWRAVHEDMTVFPGEMHPAMVALRTSRPVSNVVMGVHKPDDTLTWILVNARPLLREGDPDAYAVVASFTDITPIKAIELELQQSEARLRSIFETIQDVMWSVELPSMQMVYMNPAASRLFGRPLSDFYEDRELIARMAHPEDADRTQQAYDVILREGSHEWEFRIVRPDGQTRWIFDRAWLVRDGSGVPARFEGILTDITERKLLQQQNLELQMERERVQMLNDFIANTSHELRTPLATISTGVYLMTRLDDPEQRAERARQIDRQVHYLNRMINQLQDMARLDQMNDIELTALRPEELVYWVTSGYASLRQAVRVVQDLTPDLPQLAGNREYIRVALMHLLDNALRFSPPGGEVIVRAWAEQGEVLISVQDHGPGISHKHLPRIFEHFYKADDARTRDDNGAGMGLAIVRRIMTLHKGRVTVRSEVGSGSTFCLHFQPAAFLASQPPQTRSIEHRPI